MPYQENCKVEGHILTRFKVARLYYHDQMNQQDIAQKIACHRNTVGNIIKLCKQQTSKQVWTYLTSSKNISKELLYDLFSFLKAQKPVPHAHPKQLQGKDEQYILNRHKDLGYGPKRLFKTLKREKQDIFKYSLPKIKGVYKRNNLKKKTVRTGNKNRRALYDYAKISAFEQLQYDTKEILDKKALPQNIYELFKNNQDLPLYQWTIIDAKTRTRFLAWSYHLSSFHGAIFLFFVICWLRAHGIYHHIHTQFDGGAEFCSASKIKLAFWNALFAPFNVSVSQTEGVKWKQNLIERSHKDDDQEFYVPRGKFITTKADFLTEAQQWILYWNSERSHSGIGMNDLTPLEKLEQLGIYQAKALSQFPAIILDDLFKPLQSISDILKQSNAQKVLTQYLPSFL